MLSSILYASIGGSVFAIALAIVLQAPKRALIYCAVNGFMAVFIRKALVEMFAFELQTALLIASFSIGIASYAYYRFTKLSTIIFGATSMIPLLPGSYIFYTQLDLLAFLKDEENMELLHKLIVDLIEVITIIPAVTIGIIIPSLIFDRLR